MICRWAPRTTLGRHRHKPGLGRADRWRISRVRNPERPGKISGIFADIGHARIRTHGLGLMLWAKNDDGPRELFRGGSHQIAPEQKKPAAQGRRSGGQHWAAAEAVPRATRLRRQFQRQVRSSAAIRPLQARWDYIQVEAFQPFANSRRQVGILSSGANRV